MRIRFALLALFVCQSTLATTDPSQFMTRVPSHEITVEDLAYAYFHRAAQTTGPTLIIRGLSEEGANRLKAEVDQLKVEINDQKKHIARLQHMCAGMRSASTAEQFAAVFVDEQQRDYREQRARGKQILLALDIEDRRTIEDYLDTDYRTGFGRTDTDWASWFTSEPFPSPTSTTALGRCVELDAHISAQKASAAR